LRCQVCKRGIEGSESSLTVRGLLFALSFYILKSDNLDLTYPNYYCIISVTDISVTDVYLHQGASQ
jgi:hypothetical protein